MILSNYKLKKVKRNVGVTSNVTIKLVLLKFYWFLSWRTENTEFKEVLDIYW